jgi:hypothetical protein
LSDFSGVIPKFASPTLHQRILKSGVDLLLRINATLGVTEQPSCRDLVNSIIDRARIIGMATNP